MRRCPQDEFGASAFGLGATVLLAAMSGAASAPAATDASHSTPADAMIVSEWNAIAQAETLLLRPTAHGQMRGMAMVQGAV